MSKNDIGNGIKVDIDITITFKDSVMSDDQLGQGSEKIEPSLESKTVEQAMPGEGASSGNTEDMPQAFSVPLSGAVPSLSTFKVSGGGAFVRNYFASLPEDKRLTAKAVGEASKADSIKIQELIRATGVYVSKTLG